MALSKKDLMINITMNELYNTHSLILQQIEALVSPTVCVDIHFQFSHV
jgi:hypothetical protein